ncbi:hypothetical protein [Desulforamulus ferrireducens]|nr:hypothetical protein [Desulforamulus ferrireducens]
MEDKREEMNPKEPTQQQRTSEALSQGLSQGLDEAMFKLLKFQAQQGADQNSTMIMLALMNLLGIVNCLNKVLPEKQKVRGTEELAAHLSGVLGGVPGAGAANDQAIPNQGGIDPAMIAALASMLGNRGSEGTGGKPALDPAIMAALSMMGNPGGGSNPATLMAMLANLLGPKRPPETQKSKEHQEEKPVAVAEEKGKHTQELPKKEPGHRGVLKWDPRFGSPTSSF